MTLPRGHRSQQGKCPLLPLGFYGFLCAVWWLFLFSYLILRSSSISWGPNAALQETIKNQGWRKEEEVDDRSCQWLLGRQQTLASFLFLENFVSPIHSAPKTIISKVISRKLPFNHFYPSFSLLSLPPCPPSSLRTPPLRLFHDAHLGIRKPR